MSSNVDTAEFSALNWRDLVVNEMGSKVYACDCCGSTTRRIWGWVDSGEKTIAAYFVNWVFGKWDHGVSFEVLVGRWGDSASSADRGNVRLNYRTAIESPSFMVVDAERNDLSDHAFGRSEVIGTSLADHVFAIADAVLMKDTRLAEVRGWSRQ